MDEDGLPWTGVNGQFKQVDFEEYEKKYSHLTANQYCHMIQDYNLYCSVNKKMRWSAFVKTYAFKPVKNYSIEV